MNSKINYIPYSAKCFVLSLFGIGLTLYSGSSWFVLIKEFDRANMTLSVAKTFSEDVPTIYIITPTYTRLEQKADLTRMSQTLQLVPNIHWIIVEDSVNKTALVTKFLQNARFPHSHLFIKTMNTSEWRMKTQRSSGQMHRGVQQRNLALDWLQNNVNASHVVYFADDDNTYDVRIFEQMRSTIKVSVWPVALVGGAKYNAPAVKNGKNSFHGEPVIFKEDLYDLWLIGPSGWWQRAVVGWISGFNPDRPFAIDMAGFSINGDLLKKIPARFSLTVRSGTIETTFLSALKIKMEDLEPKANNCTEILVWHTQTKASPLHFEEMRKSTSRKFAETELEV